MASIFCAHRRVPVVEFVSVLPGEDLAQVGDLQLVRAGPDGVAQEGSDSQQDADAQVAFSGSANLHVIIRT